MSKQSLLLVDGDTRSLRVLEVSLRKAGFSVTPAVSVGDALDKLEINPPDLIISETKFATELDGFELRRRLRGTPEWSEIPFIFLTAETAIENKIKGLELGVDDYLTKPIYIKEIVTRINILLQKRQRQFLDLRKDGTRFAGRVSDMPVVDVIQTIEVSRKSGVIQFVGGPNRQAAIYFRDGKVIDAEAGTLQGEDAVYRLLTWNDGEFEVEFRTVRRREVIEMSSQGLLMEGMRRLDEWSRLLEQLPPLSHRFEIDAAELSTRLGEVPDDNNRILRLFDSKRTLLEVIDASDFGDLECLQAISRLYFEGLLIDLDPQVRRDSKSMPAQLYEDSAQTPMQVAASGPINLTQLEARASEPAIATDISAPPAHAGPTDSTASVDTRTERAPAPKVSLTQGWDVPELPADLAAAEAAARAPDASSAAEVDTASEPLISPSELAADARPRRDSSQAIDETDVVEEEPVRGPLLGGYRQSSLRLIDEAVAAAQLLEPSLFADDELAALGIKRATPEEIAAAAAAAPGAAAPVAAPAAAEPQAAALARVTLESRTSDPRIENARDLVEKTPALADSSNGSNGQSGRARRKSAPPPIPGGRKLDDIADAPLLDSDLLTSGEHRIPSDDELSEVPLLDSDLLTSGEHRIPSERALSASPPPSPPARASQLNAGAVAKVEHTPEPLPEPIDDEDSGGVPTAIESEDKTGADLADEGPTDPSRKRIPQPVQREDSQGVKMIGSAGRDRAEAAGELRPPNGKSAEAPPQRELVTIMPRRKTGEVAQLNAEEISTLDSKGKAKAAVEAHDAATAKRAQEGDDEEAEKAAVEAAPAVEPPSRPSRPPPRVSVEGGTVAPERGPGRLAQILIVLAMVIAGAAMFSVFRKKKHTTKPVVSAYQDAGAIATVEIDAPAHSGFGADASVMVAPTDAAQVAMTPRDAAVVMMRPDAAQIAMTPPDAAVVVPRPDAAAAVVATVDAGVDKGKEAAALVAKARGALAEGEAQAALDLFDQALKLKKDKRTFVDRGRALHNLGRTEDAVKSIDEAIKMAPTYAPAYEQKGLILWSAQKYDEARPALEKYLEIVPDGARADTIRKMLDEPR